jgi:hypothetical protein
MQEMDQLWSDGVPFTLEMELVVNTVMYAILNPSKYPKALLGFVLMQLPGCTNWDVTRFADRVKNSKVTSDGSVSEADGTLPEYFEQATFGDLTEPATILDMHGRVMVWALPGVMHPNRLVSP